MLRTSQRAATDLTPPHRGLHAKTPQLKARFLMNLLTMIRLRIEMDRKYSTRQKSNSPLLIRAIPKGSQAMIKLEKIARLPNLFILSRIVKLQILHYFVIKLQGNNTLTEMTP